MRTVEELERSLLEGARKELAPSARDRMRVQNLLLGNEAWFQPAPPRRNSLRSFARSWRGGVALGFALGALIGFGAAGGLELLSRPEVSPPEVSPLEISPPEVLPPVAKRPPAAPEALLPVTEDLSATTGLDSEAAEEAQVKPALAPRREATPRSGQRAAEEDRSTLAQELALLQRARRALNRQDAQLALGIVQSLDERFPEGVLMEERAATRILSLCQLERTEEARAQGQHFLAAHPRSVYAERVRRSCAGKQ
jgi:hypothetical protein